MWKSQTQNTLNLFRQATITNINFIVLLLNLCCGISFLHAQDIPPVSVFTSDIYEADNQNWSVTQTDDKTMFFANSKGLLKYDGERWELLGSLNNTILRSVHAKGNDIYTGAYMEFGVWKLNENNRYEYHSLSTDLDLVEDEQFWNITTYNKYIIFQSLDAIYMYHVDNEDFEIFVSKTEFTKMVIHNNELYYHEKDRGLFKLINGIEVPVNNSELFKNSILINIYEIGDNVYAQTQNNGIINIEDNSLFKLDNSSSLLSEISVYSSLQNNNDIYLGTISNGLIKISENRIVQRLDQKNALSNNTVLNLYQDFENNIWLSLDNGINCINIDSDISIYNDQLGMLGTIYASINFDDNIYLGSNQGLFIFDSDNNTYNFIEGTSGQVWSLFKHDNTLFCGHHNGTYIINGSKAKLLENTQGTWTFNSIDSNTIMTGNYEGLRILTKSKSGWKYNRKIKGFDISTKYFEFVDAQSILVNHEYKGIFNLKLNNDYSEVISIAKDNSVSKGLYSSIVKLKDKILYAYENGIYHYNTDKLKFEKDSILSKLYQTDNYSSGRLSKTEDNKIWIFSKSDISIVTLGSIKNEYNINKIPLNLKTRNQISGYENVSLIGADTYLIGKNDGYFKVKNPKSIDVKPKVFLGSINAFNIHNEELLFITEDNKTTEFENKYNNLEFKFSTINYNPVFKSEFQYRLEGYEDTWSSWDSRGEVVYKNLSFGKYTFQARSRIGQGNISEVISFDFTINRPWYISNLMIFTYILIFLIVTITIHLLYKNNYNKKKEKIRKASERQLEINELENQKEIMRIKNEKLKMQVENKNRELAISTMSMIKKNEFLSQIKSELKPLQNKSKKVKEVLKTINDNLNSNDDWKFFEEAFNNADKDFFKKLKNNHEELTTNELKLCAYLRLNLTSKEIAPLFNISPKSVEVKRYRLRKKMKLERDTSLIDYILSI